MMNPFFRTCGGALYVHGQDLLVNFSLLHLMDDNILFPQEVFAFLLMQSYQPQTSEKTVLVRSEFNNPILKTPDTLYQEKNDSKQNENTTNYYFTKELRSVRETFAKHLRKPWITYIQ